MTYGRIAPAHDLLTRHKVAEILAAERAKIVRMLTDLADLKFIAIGAQRTRLLAIERALRLALLETELELQNHCPLSPGVH